jgi:hypothetical protein
LENFDLENYSHARKISNMAKTSVKLRKIPFPIQKKF